ncbi:hypothetical protein ID855_22285, partial [Xenorhabdus sp. ZM]|nr:hypothetical protein [Xenorhabdus sp. ZM]
MKFCGICNEKVADHLNFCPECGSKIEEIADQTASSRSEVQREIKPVKSKKNIMLLICFVVIFAI